MAISILLRKHLFDRMLDVTNYYSWLAYPLGIVCEVSDRSVARPQHHAVLEKSFQCCRNPGEEQVGSFKINLCPALWVTCIANNA